MSNRSSLETPGCNMAGFTWAGIVIISLVTFFLAEIVNSVLDKPHHHVRTTVLITNKRRLFGFHLPGLLIFHLTFSSIVFSAKFLGTYLWWSSGFLFLLRSSSSFWRWHLACICLLLALVLGVNVIFSLVAICFYTIGASSWANTWPTFAMEYNNNQL